MNSNQERFAVIVNPNARKIKRVYLEKNPFWERYASKDLTFLTHTPRELEKAAQEIAEKGIETVVILGGDGTFQKTLTALVKRLPSRLPAILPLAGGTMNALCVNLESSRDPEEVLSAFCSGDELEQRGFRVVPKYLLQVENQTLNETIYGFTFANGVIHRAFGDYYKRPNPGVRDAVRTTVKGVLSGLLPESSPRNRLRPIKATVRADGKTVAEGQVRVVTASTLDNPVLWFKPFPYMLNGRPAFHCLVNSMGAKELVLHAWPLMRGKFKHPAHFVDQVSELEIEGEGGYILDGEVFEAEPVTRLRITAGPLLRFLAFSASRK